MQRNYINETPSNYKAVRKMEKWANSPFQINHRIIREYLLLERDNKIVTLHDFENVCKGIVDKFGNNIFKKNYHSMKTESGHSHGKIFEEFNEIVTIWEPVKDAVNQHKNRFLAQL